MKKLLIFDYDGVIVDSLDIIWDCFNKINKKYKLFPFKNKNELTRLWGENEFLSVSKFKIPGVDLAKFYKEWVDLLLVNNEKVKPFPGLKSILEKLSKDNHLTIISSNDDEVISDFLKRNDLFEYFDLILGTKRGKRKGEKVKLALKKFKIPEDRTYFITDAIGDLKEVKDFEIKTVAVAWGYHGKSKLQKENPDFLIETPKEFLALFL